MEARERPSVLGRSLLLVDGDLRLDRGDLVTVVDRENLLQGLAILLDTPYGSDVFHVDYGFDLLGILSAPATLGMTRELIRLNIVKCLSFDNRIRQIKEIVFDDESRFFELQRGENRQEHDAQRRTSRRWQALVILVTVEDEEVGIQFEGTGLTS